MRYKLVVSDPVCMDTCRDCCMAVLSRGRTLKECTVDKEFFLKYGECTEVNGPLMHFVLSCGDKLNNNTRVL